MSKPLLKSSAINARRDRAGLISIVVFQVAVLLVILTAVMRYIDWTSEAAQAEFIQRQSDGAGAGIHATGEQLAATMRSPQAAVASYGGKGRACVAHAASE
jgi:hypothetical protein